MIRFLILLLFTIILASIWVVTSVTMQISGQAHLNLTVPWWHVALQIVMYLMCLATSMAGVAMVLNRHSRRKPANYRPQKT